MNYRSLISSARLEASFYSSHNPIMLRVISTLILALSVSVPASAATQNPQPPQPTGPGRVVATVSVEGLRVPGVTVELRDVTGNVVIGRTATDTIGQTTIP